MARSVESPVVNRFREWNDALARNFFRPEAAGTRVHLFVVKEVIDDVGQRLGQGYDDFLASVRAGPPDLRWHGHCQRALQTADGWRNRQIEYPPYVAYLALFVLAAGLDGAFAPQAYYPRLWTLLGESGNGTLPSFHRMSELWDDLEQWSTHDRGGELGVFEARSVGGKVHIGLPLAQTILTQAERGALPRLFADAQLDPGRGATSQELRRSLAVHGHAHMRRSTMRVLDRGAEALQQALLDAVAEVLLSWDGSVPTSSGRIEERRVFAGLRLCLRFDRVAQTIRSSVRVLARQDFPDVDLNFAGLASGSLECAEYFGDWSTPCREPGTEIEFEPDQMAWTCGLEGVDARVDWRVRLKPARVRIFMEGQAFMLPGLIEVLELPRDAPFYIAFDQTAAGPIRAWLDSDCEGWKPLTVSSGLPAHWMFGEVAHARSDSGLTGVRPELGHTDLPSLRLVGGVHAGRANTFFSFGPPRAAVSGVSKFHQLRVNDLAIEPSAEASLEYSLPDDLPTDSRIGLDLLEAGEVVRRSSLYLLSGIPWRIDQPLAAISQFGQAVEEGQVCGAVVPAAVAEDCPVDPLRAPELGGTDRRVHIVGRRRGEIATWPREPIPRWRAVWAVPIRKRGRAIFLGSSLADAEPIPERVGTPSDQKRWRSLLWHKRKRIVPPPNREQNLLWMRYRSAARDR